jgi:hypothetical protein
MFTNNLILPALFLTFFFAVAFVFPGDTDAATRSQVRTMVVEEAQRNGTVPASLALAVAKVESGFDERAESIAGARGVMQIMPKTARGEYNIAADRLWDPRLNIRTGIAYLEKLYHQYGKRWNLALSHYNGGTLNGKGKYAQAHSYTRGYVSSVLAWSHRYERNSTAVALASASSEKKDSHSDHYWMYDTPIVDKSWRHYLKVADHWMKPENKRAAERDNMAYWDEAESSEWTPVIGEVTLPSERLKEKVNTLRTKFRESLERSEGNWTLLRGGRKQRFS